MAQHSVHILMRCFFNNVFKYYKNLICKKLLGIFLSNFYINLENTFTKEGDVIKRVQKVKEEEWDRINKLENSKAQV